MKELVKVGTIVEVRVKELPEEIYYATPDTLEGISRLRISKKIHILSPFDNLVIQRERMKLLFDFAYTIECYVPAPKRIFGYFVCPILWGSDLVARIDMKTDRKTKTLIVNSLHYENGLKDRKQFDAALNQELEKFAAFTGCEAVAFKKR